MIPRLNLRDYWAAPDDDDLPHYYDNDDGSDCEG